MRTLRARSRSGKPVEDSIGALEVDPASIDDLRITPVLTAHPTEAKRRAVVEHLWRIGALLEQLEDRSLGASEEQEIRRRMREEIAGLWRTDPIRPPPARAARRGARRAGAVRPDDLHDAPGGLSRDGSHARRRRLRLATAVVRAVPPLGHLGRRRPGREPAGDGGGDACRDGHPIRSRVARIGGRVPADRAHAVGLGTGRAAQPRAPPGPRARRRCAAGRGRASSDGRCPTRRTGGSSGCPRTGWPRPAPGAKGAYDGPAAFLGDLDVLQRSLDAGGGPAPGVGRAPAPALAGGDVRLPPGVDGGPAALERAGCGSRGARGAAIDAGLRRRRAR